MTFADPVDPIDVATHHVRDILAIAVAHAPRQRAVVVFDAQSGLSRIVAAAYRACLPEALHIDFDAVTPSVVMDAFQSLVAGDLVVLIQSTSFRLEAFRIRVELFKRGLKVIEHPHLGRMRESEYAAYVESLAYDPAYYRTVGRRLKALIDDASGAVVDTGAGARLIFDSPFESAKLNIGDYADLANVGGQFPIGEVFTEARVLERVHGKVRIFVFGDTQFHVNVPVEPITLVIEAGKVAHVENSTPDFDRVIANIQAEEEVWIRELGFGMNRAFSPQRRVSDIGTFERMCGVHLSLGAKHGVYNKPNLKRKDAKFHVDVFPLVESVQLDGRTIFRNDNWCV